VCWSCKKLTNTQFEITPKTMRLAIYRTWILPSSCRLGFLHLTIHVRYVKGQTMLMRCCFVIIVMVDTIYSAISWSSFEFPLTFGTVHHVFLHHLDFYLDHVTLFQVQVWGGYMKISSQPPLMHFIYMCMHLFLVDYFLPLTSFSFFVQ
jgi:hypothetical protein